MPGDGIGSHASSSNSPLTLDAISALLDQKLDTMQGNLRNLERQMGELNIVVEGQFQEVNQKIKAMDLRIHKLEAIP